MPDLSSPNTRVTFTGAYIGATSVPKGTTVSMALAAAGVTEPERYAVTKDRKEVAFATKVETDTEFVLVRR